MNNGSSAFIASGTHSLGWSLTISCHHRSRPSCHAMSALVRANTMTLLTLVTWGLASALSTQSLRRMIRPARTPSSAVITNLAPQLSIRSASASAEKPANTIVCTAPIRVQASIAIAASGTIGIYRQTTSPFLMPWAFNAFENWQTCS